MITETTTDTEEMHFVAAQYFQHLYTDTFETEAEAIEWLNTHKDAAFRWYTVSSRAFDNGVIIE